MYVSMSWNDRHKILNGCNRGKEFAWHMSLGLRDRPQRTAERSVPPLNEDKNKIYSYPFYHPRKIQQKNLKVRLAFYFTLKHARQFHANGRYRADTGTERHKITGNGIILSYFEPLWKNFHKHRCLHVQILHNN